MIRDVGRMAGYIIGMLLLMALMSLSVGVLFVSIRCMLEVIR